jgi:CheY-like chemotaxis protein
MAKVLIMEDDLDLADQWTRALHSAGHEVWVAKRNGEAERLCSEIRFDLAIVDLFIADATGNLIPEGGLLLITHLRNPMLIGTPEWGRAIPILAVTGGIRTGDFDPIEYAVHAGANTGLPKPVTPEVLAAAAACLLEDGESIR